MDSNKLYTVSEIKKIPIEEIRAFKERMIMSFYSFIPPELDIVMDSVIIIEDITKEISTFNHNVKERETSKTYSTREEIEELLSKANQIQIDKMRSIPYNVQVTMANIETFLKICENKMIVSN